MNGHSELKLDALRNIQPMELEVKQMCQAAVELVQYIFYTPVLHSLSEYLISEDSTEYYRTSTYAIIWTNYVQ